MPPLLVSPRGSRRWRVRSGASGRIRGVPGPADPSRRCAPAPARRSGRSPGGCRCGRGPARPGDAGNSAELVRPVQQGADLRAPRLYDAASSRAGSSARPSSCPSADMALTSALQRGIGTNCSRGTWGATSGGIRAHGSWRAPRRAPTIADVRLRRSRSGRNIGKRRAEKSPTTPHSVGVLVGSGTITCSMPASLRNRGTATHGSETMPRLSLRKYTRRSVASTGRRRNQHRSRPEELDPAGHDALAARKHAAIMSSSS